MHIRSENKIKLYNADLMAKEISPPAEVRIRASAPELHDQPGLPDLRLSDVAPGRELRQARLRQPCSVRSFRSVTRERASVKQMLTDSFSAVAKPNFARLSKYSLESS